MSMCSKCGAEMKEGVNYCKECGSGTPKANGALNQKKERALEQEKKGVKTAVVIGALVFAALSAWVLYHTFGP